MKTSLTGIKPSGTPHLGNYLGAIRPALRLADRYETLYFIADYHAITGLRDAERLRQYTYDVAATWLACGLDPSKTILFRQSAVAEVFELAWVLACLLATGQLERGHAFKDAIAKGEAASAGTFYYPVLMAADILLYDTDVVPIGRDQQQHLELARDVATRMNHVYGDGTVVVPEALFTEAPVVPGTDGRKMSKSYDNYIPLFAPAKELRAAIMKIQSSSEPLEAPKDPEPSAIYQLYRAVAPAERADELAASLRRGGYGWGHAKQALFEELDGILGPRREVYARLRADEEELDAILERGAERARAIAARTMARVRLAVGISRPIDPTEKRTARLKAQR